MQPAERETLRASDADRQRVADLLGEAYADGRLDLGEFNERINAVWAAKLVGDLAPLTADLGGPPPVVAPTSSGQAMMRLDDVRPMHTYALMSGRRQSGDWVVPASISAVAIMGSAEYDFRHATFTSPRVRVNAGVLMGTVELRVPDGVNVLDRTTCIMGSVDLKGLTPAQPGAPIIELTGFVCMGSIDVRGVNYASAMQKLGLARTDD